jgi:hypothetical protein
MNFGPKNPPAPFTGFFALITLQNGPVYNSAMFSKFLISEGNSGSHDDTTHGSGLYIFFATI